MDFAHKHEIIFYKHSKLGVFIPIIKILAKLLMKCPRCLIAPFFFAISNHKACFKVHACILSIIYNTYT